MNFKDKIIVMFTDKGCPFFMTTSKIAGEKYFVLERCISKTPVPLHVKNALLTVNGLPRHLNCLLERILVPELI